MNIGDICNRELVIADAATNLQEAAVMMRERHVGTLLVADDAPEGAQVVGIVTDRDLVVEAMARGLNTAKTEIGSLETDSLAAVAVDASLDEAVSRMKERGVRRLLVTEDGGRLVGLVSLDDLLDAFAHEMAEFAYAVRAGIERENAERPPLSGAELGALRVAPSLLA